MAKNCLHWEILIHRALYMQLHYESTCALLVRASGLGQEVVGQNLSMPALSQDTRVLP